MRVAVGEHDVFFPFPKLHEASRAKLNLEPLVGTWRRTFSSEEPEVTADMVAALV